MNKIKIKLREHLKENRLHKTVNVLDRFISSFLERYTTVLQLYSRISPREGAPTRCKEPTSDAGAFQRKHVQKQKNWILLGAAHRRRPWLRQCQ